MKPGTAKKILAAGAIIFVFAVPDHFAQQAPMVRATGGFSSESFHEAPHDGQVKMRLSGVEAQPLPGGLLDVKQLKVETFSTSGRPEIIVLAPQCTYAPLDDAEAATHKPKIVLLDERNAIKEIRKL